MQSTSDSTTSLSQRVERADEKLLTMDRVAARLSISKQRVYELARSGILPVVRIGRQLRVDPRKLEEWIRQGGVGLSESGREGE